MSTLKNTFISCLCIIAIMIFTSSACNAGSSVKIGIINMQKVVKKSSAGKKAMEELGQKFEALKQKLKARQDEIKKFKNDLAKKAPLMSEDARMQKERELQKMLRDFKEKSDDAQFEMRQAESKRMEPVLKKLEKVVQQVGKDGKYTLIIEENMPGVYYYDVAVDITETVIKALNEQK